MTTEAAATSVGVSANTLRRWVAEGVIPEYSGDWDAAAIGKARLVKRIRDRGYSLAQIREATQSGRLALGRIVELFDLGEARYSRQQIADETRVDRDVIDRMAAMLGPDVGENLVEADAQLLRYIGTAIDIGLPAEALLQLARIYIQAMSQIADAEVRLVHMYVHEPLMRSSDSAEEVGDELLSMAENLVPLTSPVLEQLHRRFLAHYIDQDVVWHIDADPAEEHDVGKVTVAIAFADLAGYTQMTEERGDLHALGVVDRFLTDVTATLPSDARVIKTIGDAVMVVCPDPGEIVAWAVAFSESHTTPPLPRIAVHYGEARYRDGDYFGREVNLASRISGESGAGEVLVSRAVMEHAAPGVQYEPLEEIRMKGFSEAIEVFLARRVDAS
jgi:adenylate cyclase